MSIMLPTDTIGKKRKDDPRYRLAETLMQPQTKQIEHPLEGLANMAKMMSGAYMTKKLNQEYDTKEKQATDTLMGAMSAYGRSQQGGETPTPKGAIKWNQSTPEEADQMFMSAISKNPETAPIGLGMQLDEMSSRRALAAELAKERALFPMELEKARALAGARAMALRDPTGGDTGALLDRIVEAGRGSDPNYDLLDALQALKGGAGASGRLQAEIDLGQQAEFEKQTGKNTSDLQYAPLIKSAEKTAELKATGASKADEDIAAIEEFMASAQRFKNTIDSNEFTGPVAGRAGAIIQDPNRTNMVSAQNELTLRAKALLGMPSANFSDADRDFLTAIAGGKYGRAEGLKNVVARLEQMGADQKRILLSKKNRLVSGTEAAAQDGGQVTVKNPKTGGVYQIDPSDLPAAQAEGFVAQ